MQLAQAYIAKEDYNNARQVLSDLQQYSELNNFASLQNIIISLKEQNKSLFEIKKDATLYQTIQSIAEDSLHAPYSGARAILTLIDDRHYPEVIRFNASTVLYRLRRDEVRFSNGQKLLRNYPNPFSNQTIIEAQVDDKLVEPLLIIYDIVGKVVSNIKLHGGFNDVIISGGTLNPGAYFYSIVAGNKKIATEKMICTQ